MRHLTRAGLMRCNYGTLLAWDIEATDWRDMLCLCAAGSDDNRAQFIATPGLPRGSRTNIELIESFLDWLYDSYTEKQTKRLQLVSHWGGIYDHLLLLEAALCLPTAKLVKCMAGESFGVWSIDLAYRGRVYRFRDSARLMPTSLAKLCQAFSVEKAKDTTIDRSRLDSYPLQTVVDYCARDCDALLECYGAYSDVWRELGVEPRGTVAATSAALVRANCVPEDCFAWNPEEDALAYRAYYGGRTEVFRRELAHGNSYDIVSSYPFAMTRALPTRFKRAYVGYVPERQGETACIYHCRVRVAGSGIPHVPYRPQSGPLKGKLVFPSGEFDAWLCGPEFQKLDQKRGQLVKVHTTLVYRAEPWLADHINRLYARKENAPNDGIRYVAKLALNAVSGKLVENPEHEYITTDIQKFAMESTKWEFLAQAARNAGVEPPPSTFRVYRSITMANGARIPFYAIKTHDNGGLRHAASGAYVLSIARARLSDAIDSDWSAVAYCDTDSIKTTGALMNTYHTPTGNGLGQWKLEHTFQEGEFLRPKLYSYIANGKRIVHAKGMRLPEGESLDSFWSRIKKGEPIVSESTRGFREGLIHGANSFQRIERARQFRSGIDKRCFDGAYSRPWSIPELA